MQDPALVSSLTDSGVCWFSLLERQALSNLIIQAVNLKRCGWERLRSWGTTLVYRLLSLSSPESRLGGIIFTGDVGQSDSCSLSQSRPFHKSSCSISLRGRKPLGAQSAGFCSPLTWLHRLGGIMNETRLRTYALNQWAFLQPVDHNCAICPLSVVWTCPHNLVNKWAPQSSPLDRCDCSLGNNQRSYLPFGNTRPQSQKHR